MGEVWPEGTMKARRKRWADEFAAVQEMGLPGNLEWSGHNYEAFRYSEEGVTIIFYPHKTTAGHHHIRIREQGSKNVERAHEIMRNIDHSRNSCTFSRGVKTLESSRNCRRRISVQNTEE